MPHLITAVRRGGEALRQAEEPQGEPYTDYYAYWPFGGFVVPPEITDGAKGVDGGQFQVRMTRSAEWLEAVALGHSFVRPTVGSGVVITLARGQPCLASVANEYSEALTGPMWSGRWVRLKEPPATMDPAQFLEAVRRERPDAVKPEFLNGRAAAVGLIGVVFEEEVAQGVMEDAWVFVVIAKPRASQRGRSGKATVPSVVLVRGMRGGEAHLRERIPELKALGDAQVTVLGLGTLGAPLAKEMARNLVGELHVVDHDFVDAGTAVRWERGFDAAGVLKPLALADDLNRNYPHTKVVGHCAAVGAAVDATGAGDRELFASVVTGSDLVLEATAEDNVTAAAADACWQSGTPLIVVWSIEGFGGVVGRIIPGETGCFHCLELLLGGVGARIALPVPGDRARLVQPPGCADPTFTSPAPDLRPLVDHASRMAFGELSRGDAAGYPRHVHDVYVFFL